MADNHQIKTAYMRWFQPLVKALRELGGSAPRLTVIQRIIENEGVTPEELAEVRGKSGRNRVENEIDFARNTLKEAGVLDNKEWGVWAFTDYGKTVDMTDDLVSEIIRNVREENRKNREENLKNREKEKVAQDNALGDAGVETVHYWIYTPGKGASMWDDFYERGVMGLGWHELGDLLAYETKEDIREKLNELCGEETSQKNSTHAV